MKQDKPQGLSRKRLLELPADARNEILRLEAEIFNAQNPNYYSEIHLEQEPQMMICPKAKTCGKGFCHGLHREPHEKFYDCIIVSSFCPSCIPYSPEKPQPATCPDCKKVLREIAPMEYSCGCDDLQPKHCTLLYEDCPSRECKKDKCEYWKSEQPTQMPLREQFKAIIEQLMKHGWAACPPNKKCADNDENTCVDCFVDKLEVVVQAHDSAVAAQAVKEFAEKVIHNLHLMGIERAEFIENIRAMAEEKE